MEEMMILSMLLCIGLTAIGLKMKVWPVIFISSIGWVIIAMRLFQDTQEYLVLALMLAIALTQVFLVKLGDDVK